MKDLFDLCRPITKPFMFPERLVHILVSNKINLSDVSIETLNIPNHNVSFIYFTFTAWTNPRNIK